jgi:hypothetical protein
MTRLMEYLAENPVMFVFSVYLLTMLGIYGIVGIYRNINGV